MNTRVVVGELPLERYRALMDEVPIVTVDVVFLNTDRTKVLLGKRTQEPYAGVFYSFGGRLYKNERFEEAALRIAQQEIGMALSPSDLTFAGVLNEINETSRFEGINYHAVDVYFGCGIEERAIVLDDQHSEARWFDVNDPALHKNVRTRVENVLRTL